MEIRVGNQVYGIDENFDWERGIYSPVVWRGEDEVVWSSGEHARSWLGHQYREMIHFLFDVVLDHEMERGAPNV